MQTFILDLNLFKSAMMLDNQRHNKQIVEAMQIYNANFRNGPRQGNPYAYEMWMDYPGYLVRYGAICYISWRQKLIDELRNGKLEHKSGEEFLNIYRNISISLRIPPWLTEQFCSNHRSILLGKAQEKVYEGLEILEKTGDSYQWQKAQKVWNWYQQFNWKEQPAEKVMRNGRLVWPYIWPERV